MTRNVRKSEPLDNARVEFLLARYSALREEMQNRNSYGYQMLSLHLLISASILTFGLQPSAAASALFIIPIISMLLATVSAHNYLVGRRLGMMIKSDIEAEFNFVSKGAASPKRSVPGFLGLVGASGVFLTVQILAFVLGLIKIQHYTTLDIVLIISDILALLISLWLNYIVLGARTNEESPAQEAG